MKFRMRKPGFPKQEQTGQAGGNPSGPQTEQAGGISSGQQTGHPGGISSEQQTEHASGISSGQQPGKKPHRAAQIRNALLRMHRAFTAVIRKYQDESAKEGYVLCFLVLPLLLVLVIESMSYHSLIGGLQFLLSHPWAFLVNVLIVLASFTFSLVFRKRIGIILVLSLLWLFCGTANFILLFFRVTPLTGSDLLLWKDAMAVASKYFNIIVTIGIFLLIAAAAAVAVLLFIRIPSARRKPSYTRSVPMILAAFLAAWGSVTLGQNTGWLETEFRELSQSYLKNGFIYCFGASLIDVGISKPNDYSTEAIESLTENYEDTGSDSSYSTHKPNVVIVQLESFFDVNRLRDVTFSENPLPHFTELMKDNASGFFGVPVIGAGTVNSEFEVLTGMNIDDFGIGEYPYKTIVREKACESLAYNLSAYGYRSFAIHNHEGDFYDRNLVYPNLGFDSFTSVEYMWPSGYTSMDWAKDDVLTEEIEKALDSTAGQDFVFTVSVQGHGSYPTDSDTEYTHHVTVSGSEDANEEWLNQVSYYVNQLYEMDQFIGELWQMLKSRKEATILVMYGDHCPSLGLEDEDLTSGTVYDTEYFIWNNCGLTFEDGDLEAYEIGSIILNALGVSDGAVNAYHQNSGAQVKSGEMTEEDYLAGLKDLEYDILYGEQIAYGGDYPYEATTMQMGIQPITISSVELTRDQVLVVRGQNFTRYSTVNIDGKALDTLYVDSETLVVDGADPGEEAQITVTQSSLSETAAYAWRKPVAE